MQTFSFSRLKLYETCPKRFYDKYVLGRAEPVTKPLALGKAVHKAVEHKINGFGHLEAVLNGLVDADFHPEVERAEVENLVGNAPVHEGMGQTEHYVRFPLSGSPSAPYIQGYIDLVDDASGVSVTDWKTNWKTYDVRGDHQVALYALAMQQSTGADQVNGRLVFLRYNRESSHIFNRRDTDKARLWALNLAQDIQSRLGLLDLMPEKADELFPALPSGACSHCPFAVTCFRENSRYAAT